MGTTEPNGGAGNGEAGQGFLRKMISAESEQTEFGRGKGIPSRGRNLEAVDTALGLEVKLPMLCHKCG